ncbi:class I SAM-dependent methyltransferase [Nostoc sp. FACHB-110]|uniref:class I SAM-dependent DNA methyltransferase n=1 Tax=Nostoc sp. FACHB-110 TaxID=2692834 RepID=UPI001688FC00|nr:class I SAM-dependent methyltransferase [Nostoc sp. FACHB-110]MBD2435865.1 class I SAM-dependent methyltransferase [Nostoc sp. FACHB-110]
MTLLNTYSEYDAWAWIYHKTLGVRYCSPRLQILEKLLLKHLPHQANILDLCCGTGQVAQHLIAKGYELTGIDNSQKMIDYARKTAPSGKFIVDDARSFQLPSTFDAVISTSAGLNHILNIDELKKVFENVYAALQENSWFLFDLNLDKAYQIHDEQGTLVEGYIEDDYALAISRSHNHESNTSCLKLAIFYLLETGWQRSNLICPVKGYSQPEIEYILEKVGFTEINVYNCHGDLELTESDDFVYFVARKR